MGECHKSVDRIGKLLYDHHGCRVLPVDKEAGEGDNKVPRFCLRVPPGIVGKDELFVKIYHYIGLHQRFKAYFRKTGAWNEWRIVHHLMDVGIPVSKPLTVKQDGSLFHLPKRSLIAFKWFSKGHNLMQLFLERNTNRDFIKRLMNDLGRFVGKIHSAGVLPWDLGVGNILVRPSMEGQADLVLIDFEKIFFKQKLLYAECVQSIAQLVERLVPLCNEAVPWFCGGYVDVIRTVDRRKLTSDLYSASDGFRSIGDRRLDVAFNKIAEKRKKV